MTLAFNVNASKQETPSNLAVKTLQNDVMQYTHQAPNEWVKYSGGLGFGYPYKTSPQAVESDNVTYYTYSKCITTTSQNYMIVFAADSLGNKTVLRRIFSTKCDPHENAAIYVDSQGYITVAQSARGKWRKGFVFKSKRPNDISEFEQVAIGYYAYPKLHEKGMVFTDYNGSLRENWIKTPLGEKQLTKGGSYAITKEINGEIHMVYTYHFAGNLNARVNLYYMWSPDGEVWFNRHGEELSLPVKENSNLTGIYFNYNKFNYLKHLAYIDGELQLLVVQSTSANPILGNRELVKFTLDGESKAITNMTHNYNGAKFWNGGIIAVKSDDYGYAGGDLFEYTMEGKYISTLKGDGINYPVRVENSDKLMFADKKSNLFIVE